MDNKRSSFSGSIGFILTAAGSAVGLGNLWRFPYLAAKYGGGCFLVTYILLAVTFGFALMTAEIAIGRKTRGSCLVAFGRIDRHFKFAGALSAVIPALIMPYYSLIGGWIFRYLGVYALGQTQLAAEDGFFSTFISSSVTPAVLMFVYLTLNAIIVSLGVEKGIEGISKILMPLLIFMSVALAIFSCTRPGALAGIRYYLVPDFSDFSAMTVLAAVGQLFYSLSLAMGIMVTYGSYMRSDTDLEASVTQISLFDTLIAFLAGLMIIPAVFVYSGGDESALSAGAGLMFITIPKVFADMGGIGRVAGFIFFLLVFCAALTSSISIYEAVVSSICDWKGWSRRTACLLFWIFSVVVGVLCSLGYGILDWVRPLGMQLLDFFDFITNSVLMPISAIITCILIGWVVGTKVISDEVKISSAFKREAVFKVMIKWIVPIGLVAILISSILSAMGTFSF